MTKPSPFVELVPAEDAVETSSDSFDRVEFARRALSLVRPHRMRIAVCPSTARLQVEVGRQWGSAPDARWAIVSVPPTASRRAIALAVAGLVGAGIEPYALDVLFAEIAEASVV